MWHWGFLRTHARTPANDFHNVHSCTCMGSWALCEPRSDIHSQCIYTNIDICSENWNAILVDYGWTSEPVNAYRFKGLIGSPEPTYEGSLACPSYALNVNSCSMLSPPCIWPFRSQCENCIWVVVSRPPCICYCGKVCLLYVGEVWSSGSPLPMAAYISCW